MNPQFQRLVPTDKPRICSLIALLIALMFCLQFSPLAIAQSPEHKSIIVLHSNWGMGLWREEFTQTLRTTLVSSTEFDFELSPLYLNLSSDTLQSSRNHYVDHFNHVNQEHDISLVISLLPEASLFLNLIGEEVFPGIPKIMVGANFESDSDFKLGPDTVLVARASSEAFSQTLEQILVLRPDTRQIDVVGAADDNNVVYGRLIEDAIYQKQLPLEVIYHMGQSPAALAVMSSALPDSSVVFYLPHGPITAGMSSDTAALPALENSSTVPVFSFFDSIMGYGIVGGHLISAGGYAEKTAAITQEILRGTDPSTINASITGSAKSIYDWRQLQKWNIPVSLLPEGAEVRYREISFWQSNPVLTIVVGNLIAILVLIIAFLSFYLKRSRQSQLELSTSEKQLRESESRYRLFAENSQDVIWVWNYSESKFRYISPAIEELTGFTPEQAVEIPHQELVSKDSRKIIQATLLDPASSGILEVDYLNRDGGKVPCEVSFRPLYEETGELTGRVGVIRNITERKNAEAERESFEGHIRQGQKFESLGTLAGGIAHDFNNMLTGINGFAELASKSANNPPKTTEHLAKVISIGDKAKTLIERILTFARQSESNKKSISLNQSLKDSVKLLHGMIPSTCEICARIDRETIRVQADYNQIEQIIINLVTNAYQASDDGRGMVNIELCQESLDNLKTFPVGNLLPGDYAVIKVRDQGQGLTAVELERIFDPFYSSKQAGNGMGLAIVHGIVLDHGGAIDVKSEKGIGSEFRIYLPMTEAEEEEENPENESTTQSISLKKDILIVDDQAEVLDVLCSMIEYLGCRCIKESDPEAAADFIMERGDELGLVITDFSMANMTGIELIRACRESHPDLPFVLSTGFGKDISEEYVKGEGAYAVLPKPYSMQNLQQIIQSI